MKFEVGQKVKVPWAGSERSGVVVSVLDPRVEAYLDETRRRDRRLLYGKVFVELVLAGGAARVVQPFRCSEVEAS